VAEKKHKTQCATSTTTYAMRRRRMIPTIRPATDRPLFCYNPVVGYSHRPNNNRLPISTCRPQVSPVTVPPCTVPRDLMTPFLTGGRRSNQHVRPPVSLVPFRLVQCTRFDDGLVQSPQDRRRGQRRKGRGTLIFLRKKCEGFARATKRPVGRSVALVNSNKQSHKAFCRSNWPCVCC
jgi:hypothetical protein